MKLRRTLRRGLCAGLVGSAMLAAAAPAANAALNWSETSFNFGNQNVGTTSAPHTFALIARCDAGTGPPQNLCAAPPAGVHNFGPPTVTGAGFALVPGTNACAGGVLLTQAFPSQAACTIEVTFTPTSGGARTGSLDTANGPDVALSGTGVAAPGATPGATPGSKGKKCKKKGKKRSGAAAKKKCKKKKRK